MSIRSEFHDAGIEYARRLDEQRESDRHAALAREGQHESNATAFAAAFAAALTNSDDTPAAPVDGPTANDVMAAIAADTHKETHA